MITYNIILSPITIINLNDYLKSYKNQTTQVPSSSEFKIVNKQRKKNSETVKIRISAKKENTIRDPLYHYETHMNSIKNDIEQQSNYLLDNTRILNDYLNSSIEKQKFMGGLFHLNTFDHEKSNKYFTKFGLEDDIKFVKSETRCEFCSSKNICEENKFIICEDCGCEQKEKVLQSSFTDKDSSVLLKKTENDKKKTFNIILRNIQGFGEKLKKDDMEWIKGFILRNSNSVSIMNADVIKSILKEASLSKYYEYISTILIEIDPSLGKKFHPHILDKIDDIYTFFLENVNRIKTKIGCTRKNSLNNSYIMLKILERLELHNYKRLIPEMKQTTLVSSDLLWNSIMKEYDNQK